MNIQEMWIAIFIVAAFSMMFRIVQIATIFKFVVLMFIVSTIGTVVFSLLPWWVYGLFALVIAIFIAALTSIIGALVRNR